MEVLYHVPYKAIFGGDIFLYIGLIYGRYLQFRFLKWPLMITCEYQVFIKCPVTPCT